MRRAPREAAQLLLLTLLLTIPAAHAQEPAPDFTRPGLYLAVTGNYQQEYYTVNPGFDPDSSSGVSGRLGYRLHRHFSVEAQGEWLNDFGEDALVLGNGWLFGANARGFLPLAGGRVQPTLVVGGALMRAPVIGPNRHRSSFAFRAGGGFEVGVTEHFALIFEGTWVQPTSNGLGDYPFVSAAGGFVHRF